MTRATLQAAFILHHRPFRDTSVIADLITPDHGLMSVIARGARSAASRRRVLLQPFRPLLVSWTGRSELRTLTTVEESGQAIALTGESLACAYYVTELALRLLAKGEPNVEAFALYARTLATLADVTTEPGTAVPQIDTESVRLQICLRNFEVELLGSLGLLPDLSHCDKEHGQIEADLHYQFHLPSGQAIHSPGNAATVLESVPVTGLTLLTLAQSNWEQISERGDDDLLTTLAQAKQLMRQLVRVHLGTQPLKSREVFRQLKSHSSTAAEDEMDDE